MRAPQSIPRRIVPPAALVARLALLALLVAMGAVAAGCASTATGAHKMGKAGSSGQPMPKVDSARSPAENLRTLAMNEVARGPREVQPPPPLPPGVESDALALRDPADPKARLSLHDALVEIAGASAPDIAPPASPAPAAAAAASGADRRDEALLSYARGRRAALDNRHLQAITELKKAQQLDPDSPQIVRELAHSYGAVGNQTKSLELYEQLAAMDAGNSEAVFTLGIAAAGRRDFAKAAAELGGVRLAGKRFDHDPAADLIADFTLAMALRELGYDRASVESAMASLVMPERLSGQTMYGSRIDSVFRQRGETWRSIGDALCRLGDYEQALEAYANSAALPTADPGALQPRVIYANLCLGRPFNAQHELLASISAESRSVTDRDIILCAYLRENAGPTALLADAVSQLAKARPEESGYIRLSGSLLPAEQAGELLKAYVNRQPRDLEAVGQMLGWLAQHDVTAAAALAVGLAADHPDLAEAYGDRLSVAVVNPRRAIRALQAMPESPARVRLLVQMLRKSGGIGEAWTLCTQARAKWPADTGLMLQQIQLAAAMQERTLLEQTLAATSGLNDVAGLVGVSQAWRALGDTEQASRLAQRAVEMDSTNFDALVEMSRAEGAWAATLAADPARRPLARTHVDNAVNFAEMAIAIDPTRDEPYEVLVLIQSPGGALADTAQLRQTVLRLREANPQSQLAARLIAQEMIDQRRFQQALDRVLGMYEANPADASSLSLAITAWQRSDRLDNAQEWLDRQLQQRPGDPSLVEQWVRVQLLRDRQSAAIQRLEQALKDDPDDLAARRLLESVYRQSGQMDAALELGSKRLLARPEGIRRELELAALYGAAQHADQSIARLEFIRDRAADAGQDELVAAAALAARLGGNDPRRDPLTLALVELALDHGSPPMLEVYRLGLQALARMNRLDSEFEALAQRAVKEAQGARLTDLAGIEPWQHLAQQLVDDGHPAAAARALRARIWAEPALQNQALALLGRIILVADAAAEADEPAEGRAESGHAERSIQLIDRLNDANALSLALDLSGAGTLAEGYYECSINYSLLGADAGCERLLRAALARQADYAMAMNNLGYMMVEHGQDDAEATRLLEQAQVLMPEEPNILDSIGWVRYLQGRLEDTPAADPGQDPVPGALTLLRAAVAAERAEDSGTPPSPAVLDHLGDAAWRSGQREEAAKAWRSALRVLDESGFHERILQQFGLVQSRVWQLVVVDPRTMYDREYGGLQERLRHKIEAVEGGGEPVVAPQWKSTP